MQIARMNILIAQMVEPRISQKRLPLTKTNFSMKARDETTLTTPKTPARNSEVDIEVKPAEKKITYKSKGVTVSS